MSEWIRPMQRSIAISDIYLRWVVVAILIEKKYPGYALSGQDVTLVAPGMTKKTHAKKNYWKISQCIGDISRNPAFSARHLSNATGN
jgi:hypothetical protein